MAVTLNPKHYNRIAVSFAPTTLHLPPHVLLLVIHEVYFSICNHRCPPSRKLMISAPLSLSSTCTYALRHHPPVAQQSREMTAEDTRCAVQHDVLGEGVTRGSCSGGRRYHLVMES